MLRVDANRELCRQCGGADADTLPYGEPTATGEMQCANGHRWQPGKGARREIGGRNAILFEPHLKQRRKREIYSAEGTVDPAFTMHRWGKRPTVGMYTRSRPQGRRVTTRARRKDGAGFYAT